MQKHSDPEGQLYVRIAWRAACSVLSAAPGVRHLLVLPAGSVSAHLSPERPDSLRLLPGWWWWDSTQRDLGAICLDCSRATVFSPPFLSCPLHCCPALVCNSTDHSQFQVCHVLPYLGGFPSQLESLESDLFIQHFSFFISYNSLCFFLFKFVVLNVFLNWFHREDNLSLESTNNQQEHTWPKNSEKTIVGHKTQK